MRGEKDDEERQVVMMLTEHREKAERKLRQFKEQARRESDSGMAWGKWDSEKEFQLSIRKAMRQLGWLDYATYRSSKSPKGYPDLTLAHFRHGVVFAEVKMPGGRIGADQIKWIRTLRLAGAKADIWLPQVWDYIVGFGCGRDEWCEVWKDDGRPTPASGVPISRLQIVDPPAVQLAREGQ